MYRVTCKQCGASGLTDDAARPQAAVSCPCCPHPHDHDQAANGCAAAGKPTGAQHPDAACPHPRGGPACNAVTPLGEDCPGGHCWPGVGGCTVCRPVELTYLGTVKLAGVN